MVGLKALMRTADPNTRVYVFSLVDEKLEDFGTAKKFLAVLEQESADSIVERYTCGAGRINLYMKQKENSDNK
jgi:hypothetical protein